MSSRQSTRPFKSRSVTLTPSLFASDNTLEGNFELISYCRMIDSTSTPNFLELPKTSMSLPSGALCLEGHSVISTTTLSPRFALILPLKRKPGR